MSDFDFGTFSFHGNHDLTKHLEREKIHISSLEKLVGFRKVGENLLVRESNEDFWQINKNDDGSFTIERIIGEGDETV